MSNITFSDGTVIANFTQPYIIAEVNSSHNGKLDVAREMIEKAKECGCSCVKFQSWSSGTLYSKSYYKNNPIAERIVKKFSLSENELKEMADHCQKTGIAFASTPYSEPEVDFLIECKAPFIKVASMDINNYEYLRYIARTKAPIVLSTGMAEMDEIRKAVHVIQNEGHENLALLHCISIYPAACSTIHLNNIAMLRNEFPNCPIGFSDHTLGFEIAAAATAMGTAIIEKHLTLNKQQVGMDNSMALEPQELAQLVQACTNVHAALGSYERIVSEEEYAQRLKMRRSVIAKQDLKAGTVLTLQVLGAKRPGDAFPVGNIEDLVGRVLKNDIQEDMVIYPEDLV